MTHDELQQVCRRFTHARRGRGEPGAKMRAMATTNSDSQKSGALDPNLERKHRIAREETDGQARRGLIPAVIGLGVDVTEDAITAGLGFADDARRETRQAVVATLDFAETVVRSVVGVGRRAVDRIDRLTIDTLGGAERVAIGTLAGIRSVTLNASALVDQATRSVVGTRNDVHASA